MTHSPDNVPIKSAGKSLRDVVSVVWLIPILALIVALGIAVQTYLERGPLVDIGFDSAAGVTPGQTELRYRDVAVGRVEKVGFDSKLAKVRVWVRLNKEVADYVDDDAQFWLVTPKITTRGISGLDTVLSGVYIAANWDQSPDGFVTKFDGESQPPLVPANVDALRIQLRTVDEGGLTEETPILYKGIEVGRVGPARIAPDGTSVIADAYVLRPHDRLITTATRFWDSSGFTFKLGTAGAEIDFNSIASLVSGGIAFETVVSGGRSVKEGQEFLVYEDESTARNSVFAESDGQNLRLSVIFDNNVSGLVPDAAVELNGLKIGTVTNLNGLVDPLKFGDQRVRLLTTLSIRPSRLGLQNDATADQALEFLNDRVKEGLRARLASASLLTGGLKVELVTEEDVEDVSIDMSNEPYPLIPTTDSKIADVSATAEGVFQRINNLPIEELMESAVTFLNSATAVVNSEDLRAAPEELLALLGDARNLVGSDSAKAIPERIEKALSEVEALIASVREQQAVERLLAAVDSAAQAGETVDKAARQLPALMEDIQAVAQKANGLPLEDLTRELNATLATARSLLEGEAAQALPAKLTASLDELETLLAAANREETVARILAAVDAATRAATDVSAATTGVPELIADLSRVAERAAEVPLEELSRDLQKVMQSADALIGTEAARALPERLNTSLAELATVLASVNAEDSVARILAAVDNAAKAGTDVSAAVVGVPALVEDLQNVAQRARDLPLEELTQELTQLLESADALIGTDDARALPASLNGALDQVRAVLEEFRQGGAINNLNAALSSARDAAESVERAGDQFPALVARLNGVLQQAAATLADFDKSSDLNRSAREAMRDVKKAAEAVSSLARALERRPNSLLLGR